MREAPTITLRQRRVLELLACGHTFGEIGEILGMSFKGVDEHAIRLRRRLGARNTAQAVALAVAWRLVDPARIVAAAAAATELGLVEKDAA